VTEEDRVIVDAIRAGDPAAFRDLYQRHFRRIQLGPAPGNVAGGQTMSAERMLRASRPIVIYGITRNILNNRLRRRGGVRLVSLEDIPQEAAPLDLGPESLAQARQTLGRVREAIGKLPQEQRRVLELRHGKRLNIRKISQLTGRSEDAVKSSLYRARRSLAAQLPGEHLAF
jgi:RNA polymerase sigma factor (sigma-70 family)